MPSLPTDALMGDTRLLVKEQRDRVLALFRKGHSNALFTTSVAEEGLDVQHCSLVICYDVPNRPLSLVQTVGRARARDARVVFMEEVASDGVVQTVRCLNAS
jgi:ERCC4-related helicase